MVILDSGLIVADFWATLQANRNTVDLLENRTGAALRRADIGSREAHLQQFVDFNAVVRDLLVSLFRPIVSVGEIQQRRVLVLEAFEQRRLAPQRHHLLYLLHVVLGVLQSTLEVVNHVARFRDVLPNT